MHAIANPVELEVNLANAAMTRRLLDRAVGYELSPLLWKKVRFGLSAGRTQSVTVRILTDREEEINAFIPEEFWKIKAGNTKIQTHTTKKGDVAVFCNNKKINKKGK